MTMTTFFKQSTAPIFWCVCVCIQQEGNSLSVVLYLVDDLFVFESVPAVLQCCSPSTHMDALSSCVTPTASSYAHCNYFQVRVLYTLCLAILLIWQISRVEARNKLGLWT